MYARNTMIREDSPLADPDRESLEQQVRSLRERLAFYEGFDQLIQDNVAHARELFRLAAAEREAAAEAANRARYESGQREAALRRELESLVVDVDALAGAVASLGGRISRTLGEPANGRVTLPILVASSPMAVVIHAVPSARTALSLQRFIGSLPMVRDVTAREFAGGVLHLEVTADQPLQVEHFFAWEDPRRVELLTASADVIELVLKPAFVDRIGA